MANRIPPELLLDFYRKGIFPMAVDGEMRLFSPDPRGVILLDEFRIPHGTRKTLKDPAWELRMDTAFEDVMRGCAEREETWIDDGIFESYTALHDLGHAHSVEIWRDDFLPEDSTVFKLGPFFLGSPCFIACRVPPKSPSADWWK
jgi:leucyl/phenylalanyl-tRNA--protein transferase